MKNRLNRLQRRGALVPLLALLVAPCVLGIAPFSPSVRAQQLGGKSKTALSPAPGSAERKRIVDALRVPFVKSLKQPVIFEIDHIRTQNGWAFLTGTPRQPNGKPINYAKTSYAEQQREGMFDDGFCALLHRKNGKWKVVTYNLGATDVNWIGWDDTYNAPKAIFPYP